MTRLTVAPAAPIAVRPSAAAGSPHPAAAPDGAFAGDAAWQRPEDRRRRPVVDRTAGLSPAQRAVLTGWTSARGLVDLGRPATGLRQAERTAARLDRLAGVGTTDPTWVSTIRVRLLLVMADAQVELGEVDQAQRLLTAADQLALTTSGSAPAQVRASRAVLLARTGRTQQAWVELDAAIAATTRPGAALVRMLHWRALLHLGDGRPEEAQVDCAQAHRLAEELGLVAGVVLAVHQRGLVHFVSGDLPRALADMNLGFRV